MRTLEKATKDPTIASSSLARKAVLHHILTPYKTKVVATLNYKKALSPTDRYLEAMYYLLIARHPTVQKSKAQEERNEETVFCSRAYKIRFF